MYSTISFTWSSGKLKVIYGDRKPVSSCLGMVGRGVAQRSMRKSWGWVVMNHFIVLIAVMVSVVYMRRNSPACILQIYAVFFLYFLCISIRLLNIQIASPKQNCL